MNKRAKAVEEKYRKEPEDEYIITRAAADLASKVSEIQRYIREHLGDDFSIRITNAANRILLTGPRPSNRKSIPTKTYYKDMDQRGYWLVHNRHEKHWELRKWSTQLSVAADAPNPLILTTKPTYQALIAYILTIHLLTGEYP